MSDIDGVQKIEFVLMDAIGRRTGMCCIQWKDDEDIMPKMSDPIHGRRQCKEIAEAADKSSRDEMLTVLYLTEKQGRGRDDKVEGCLPSHFRYSTVEQLWLPRRPPTD